VKGDQTDSAAPPAAKSDREALTPPASQPKISDRVSQPPAQSDTAQPNSPGSGPVAAVAQRVVLYDEDPSDPKGKQYVDSVVWRTEPIKASGNQKAEIAVRADIEIPAAGLEMPPKPHLIQAWCGRSMSTRCHCHGRRVIDIVAARLGRQP
jgi:hypothetical protein